MYKEIFRNALRPAIYSLVITLGFALLMYFKDRGLDYEFWLGSIGLYILVLLELIFTSNYYHVQHRKNSRIVYDFEDHKFIQYSHHIIVPTLYFIGMVLFIYYNTQDYLTLLKVVISFFGFLILFENIMSFYKHKFSLNKATTHIYDILGILIVFVLIYGMLNTFISVSITSIIIQFILSLFVIGINVYLLTVRNSITKVEVISATIFTFFLSFFVVILFSSSINTIGIALIVAILYRIYTVFVNYSIERLIGRNELVEELLIIMLVATILNFYLG